MGRKYKVIVSHPGQQHSFKTAAALKRSGNLFKYYTTVYNKNKSWTNIISKFLKGDDSIRANNRKSIDLDDRDVDQKYEILGLLTIFFLKVFKNRKINEKWNNWVVDIFGKKISDYAIRNKPEAVISYDNNSRTLFKKLKNTSIIRILDVSAANRLYMQKIYSKDVELCGDFAQLYGNTQLIRSKKLTRRYEDEIKFADYFIVASKFVKNSLKYSGVRDSQIKVVPYGVDAKKFSFDLKKHNPDSSVKFIFVGSVNEIKGIYYLLEAFRKLNNPDVKIDIVGKYSGKEELLKPYLPFCNFLGHIPKSKIPDVYKNADVLVFPSLGEGFGLVVLEAMACGLPVIVSKNTGASDAVVEGENGFIIDIQNEDAIIEKVTWFINNKEKIEEMSLSARKSVLSYSWDSYNTKLLKAIDEITHDNQNK